jgi:hypothetical protein
MRLIVIADAPTAGPSRMRPRSRSEPTQSEHETRVGVVVADCESFNDA